MDQIVTLETAKLAMEVGFKDNVTHLYLHGKDKLIPIAVAYTTPPYRISMNDLETPPEELSEDGVPAPTQTALSKWLREKHDIYTDVYPTPYGWGWQLKNSTTSTLILIYYKSKDGPNLNNRWDSYEECLEDALQEACKIVKDREGK